MLVTGDRQPLPLLCTAVHSRILTVCLFVADTASNVSTFNNHKKFLACYLDPKHKQLESFCLDTQPDQWLQLRCVQCVALTAIRQEVCTGIDFNRVQTLQMFLLSQATKMHFFSTWV